MLASKKCRIFIPDLSKALKDLVTRGFLQSAGATRAMVYTFPKPGLPESDVTVQTRLDGIAEQKDGISVHLGKDSVHLEDSSVHLTSGNSKKNKNLQCSSNLLPPKVDTSSLLTHLKW